ncbi:MAG TPA: Yip1 family protein [Longilinea sp.]|nr:Yip1 family protein [Longilinea sp.]
MSETELDNLPVAEQRRLRWDWLYQVILAPRKTLAAITSQDKPNWLTPMLVISLLILVSALAGIPARIQENQASATIPMDGSYYTEDQQAQFAASDATASSPLFTYILPAVGGLVGLWVGWLLMGSVLHLAYTLAGSRSSSAATMNLAAWAYVPFGVRYLIRAVYLLATRQVITSTGLSGFVDTSAGGMAAFFAALLAMVDIYLIWQVVLLVIGSTDLTKLSRSKAWAATITAVVVVLLICALPGFLSAALSGLSTGGFMFF